MSHRRAFAFAFCANVWVLQVIPEPVTFAVQSVPEYGSPEWYGTSRNPALETTAPGGSGMVNDPPERSLCMFCTAYSYRHWPPPRLVALTPMKKRPSPGTSPCVMITAGSGWLRPSPWSFHAKIAGLVRAVLPVNEILKLPVLTLIGRYEALL